MKLILFTGIILLYSCNLRQGALGVSASINDAKKKCVFIKEYTAYPNPYKINDTIERTIHEAWLEHNWRYAKDEKNVDTQGGFMLCINTDTNIVNNLSVENLSLGVSQDCYLRPSSDNSLVGDIDQMPGDTLIYPIIKGSPSFTQKAKIVVGYLILVAKK